MATRTPSKIMSVADKKAEQAGLKAALKANADAAKARDFSPRN